MFSPGRFRRRFKAGRAKAGLIAAGVAVLVALALVGVTAVSGQGGGAPAGAVKLLGPLWPAYTATTDDPLVDITVPGMTNLPDWVINNPQRETTTTSHKIPAGAVDLSGLPTESGLSSVATDATISGDGTHADPLAVARPYPGAPTPQPTPTLQPVPTPAQASEIPQQSGATGAVGSSSHYALADHRHQGDGSGGSGGSGITPAERARLLPDPSGADSVRIVTWDDASDAYKLIAGGTQHGYVLDYDTTHGWHVSGGPRVVEALPALGNDGGEAGYTDGDVIYLSSSTAGQEGWYEVVDSTGDVATLSLTGWTPAVSRTGDEWGFNRTPGEAPANLYGSRPTGMPTAVNALYRTADNGIWLETTNVGTFNSSGIRIIAGSRQWLLRVDECYPAEGGDPGYCGYYANAQSVAPWTTTTLTAGDNVSVQSMGTRPFDTGGFTWSKLSLGFHIPTIPEKYTDLTDTPSSITANAVVAGATTGNALAFKSLDALLSGHQAGLFSAFTGNGWETGTCSAATICIAQGAQSWDTGSATSGATRWGSSYTFTSAPTERELLVRVPVSWTAADGTITRAVRIAPYHIYNDDLTLLLGNSGGFDYYTASPARILPDTTVAVQTFSILSVDGSKLRIDYDQITGSPAAKPPGRNTLPTTGLYVGYRVVLLDPDVWELGPEYTAVACSNPGCVKVDVGTTGYTIASYAGDFSDSLVAGYTVILQGDGARGDGKTPAKLHWEHTTYTATRLAAPRDHTWRTSAPALVAGSKYRLNVEFTDATELVPFTTYQPGDYEWDGSVWVPTPGSTAPWAENGNTERIPVSKLPQAGILQVHNGPGTGLFASAANTDRTSGFQAFSPAFDLDDNDKQSGIFEVEATLHLSQKSAANIGFSSGGADQTIVLRGFVFASTLRTSTAYSAGLGAEGVLIDDGEVYTGTTDAGDVSLYLARNGNSRAGYYLFYDGASGTQSFAIGVDLQVAFVHNDANAPATARPRETLVDHTYSTLGAAQQIHGGTFSTLDAAAAFGRTLTATDRNRTLNIQIQISATTTPPDAKIWSEAVTFTGAEWIDATSVPDTEDLTTTGTPLFGLGYATVDSSGALPATHTTKDFIVTKGANGRISLLSQGASDTQGQLYVYRVRAWIE